jgi:16S rRNA (cytosine967-C5)-methyltransferase
VLDRRGWAKGLLERQQGFRDLAPRDRALALEIAHGVLRQLRTLRHLVKQRAGRPLERIESRALVLCLMGTYQLIWLDRVPAHAAVSETVALAGGRKRRGFVNAVLRATARTIAGAHDAPPEGAPYERLIPVRPGRVVELTEALLPDWRRDDASALGIAFSHPDALVRRWLERIGPEQTRQVLAANNVPPPVFLRANRQRTTREALLAALAAAGVEAEAWPGLPDAVLLGRGTHTAALACLRDGRASVQDATAQAAALSLWEPLADTDARVRIADLCAAPGGKACYLAELGGERVDITACDRDPKRLAQVGGAARRLGLGRIALVACDATEAGSRPEGPFDRVLVDAPCSNTGVLRRRPEARWRFSEDALAELTATQDRLLESAAAITRPGGAVVYSTCSLEEDEDRARAMAFLSRHPDWKAAGETLRLPAPGGADGGYWITLHRPHP